MIGVVAGVGVVDVIDVGAVGAVLGQRGGGGVVDQRRIIDRIDGNCGGGDVRVTGSVVSSVGERINPVEVG